MAKKVFLQLFSTLPSIALNLTRLLLENIGLEKIAQEPMIQSR
jgi:hypothetical protein